jgi:fructokinase
MRIGIDLGGTKIEGIALDGSRELARLRVETPRDDYAATVDAVVGLVDALETRAGEAPSLPKGARGSVGIGIPGTMSPATGLVKNANSVWLIGRPLLADLEQRLGRPVRIANDANCFAVSEAADGAAAGAEVVFGVILGTGTGGGIVVRGQVVVGVNAVAGEWGHNPLPWPADEERPGPVCYCGRSGCIETFLSGPGLQADYAGHTGQPRPPSEIVALAVGGDRGAAAALERYEGRLARGLASIINVLDPDVIVLGGGLSNIDRLYTNVPRLWAPYVFSDAVTTRLVKARHGDASGVRGAAWLWD